jgi:hypothetical protein
MCASRRLPPRVCCHALIRAFLRTLSDAAGGTLFGALLFTLFYLPAFTFAQQSGQVDLDQAIVEQVSKGQVTDDQTVAERVLGGQWKQMARRAGMIFAGTVLGADAPTARSDGEVPMLATFPTALVGTQLRFHVDRAIAGVDAGQIITIHEWAGASVIRPVRPGQHLLAFFYPPSRLGFTSPVGGELGEVLLDASGKNVAESKAITNFKFLSVPGPDPTHSAARRAVSVIQLERAIRRARLEREE